MDDDGIGTARPSGAPDGRNDRGRPRSVLNTLFVLVAVAGIVLSTWSVVTESADVRARSESRARIDEACGGLVEPDRVLALHGGTDRVELSDRHRVSTDERLSGCTVHRVGDPGTTYGHLVLTLTLHPADPGTDERRVELDGEPFELRRGTDDITAAADRPVPYPLGDGGLGEYETDRATARALCPDGGEISSVEATAAAGYPDPVTPEDRRTLATLARQAAERAAQQRDCAARLPRVPAELPEPKTALGPVAETGGSCAWYGRLVAEQGRGALPDRALAAPVGRASAHDACLLALGEDETRRIWPAYEESAEHARSLHSTLSTLPLWMKAETFVGDGSRGLWTDSPLSDRIDPAAPGKAGGSTWWATSVCDGRPAVHLLQVAYPYDRIVTGDRIEALLHAYAGDAAARRGCTGVAYPEAADFARS